MSAPPAAPRAPQPLPPTGPHASDAPWGRERFEEYFRRGIFAILMAIVLVATLRAYFAIERAIVTWLEYQYVPLAQAVFSLLVLGVAAWLIRAYVIARAR